MLPNCTATWNATAPGTGGGHSGHLAAGIACAACHDPHGVDVDASAGESGSHTHLVNFDQRVVQPLPGASFPIYEDRGGRSGSSALVCHGVVHDHTVYP